MNNHPVLHLSFYPIVLLSRYDRFELLCLLLLIYPAEIELDRHGVQAAGDDPGDGEDDLQYRRVTVVDPRSAWLTEFRIPGVQRVRAWRAAHPSYWKRTGPQIDFALQEDSL